MPQQRKPTRATKPAAKKAAKATKPAAKKAAKPAVKKPVKAKSAAAKAKAGVPKVRELARFAPQGDTKAPETKTANKVSALAADLLRAEFDRALALKDKLAAEAVIGGKEKGRAVDGAQEKLRAVIASLEGANRFAIKMGLVDPAQSRAMYAEAMERGLYEGWKR